MANDRVWPAMAKAFEAAKGDLAERMMAALEAAQAEGGDIRGQQSAALLVVPGSPSGRPWADRTFDLRVEDHPRPLEELRRLLVVARGYRHMNAGDLAIEKKDAAGAEREYGAAMKLLPGSAEVVFWYAAALAMAGEVERSLPLFARAYALDPAWRTLVPRLPASGLLPTDPSVLTRIEKAGAPASR
jgi:tetratricopeptide (TPR) repeat protein